MKTSPGYWQPHIHMTLGSAALVDVMSTEDVFLLLKARVAEKCHVAIKMGLKHVTNKILIKSLLLIFCRLSSCDCQYLSSSHIVKLCH